VAELAATTAAMESCPHHAEGGILGRAEALVNGAQKQSPVLPSNLAGCGKSRLIVISLPLIDWGTVVTH